MFRSLLNRKVRTARRAFTFFEITVGIVITGLVVGISVPITLNAKRKADQERRLANVKTLTDANWRLEITGAGNDITRGGNSAWDAYNYYLEKGVLAEANQINLEGLVFSNGVWGTEIDPPSHFTKPPDPTNPDPQASPTPIIPITSVDPNQRILDMLSKTNMTVDGKDAKDILFDLNGEAVEWVFFDPVSNTYRTNKVGMWDSKTGRSASGGSDPWNGGGNGGFGYGSGSVPMTITRTNAQTGEVTTETIYTGGITEEEARCSTATLSLVPTDNTGAARAAAGTLWGGGSYKIGELAYAIAMPSDGWKFKRWVRVGGTGVIASSTSPVAQIPIDACKLSYAAEFERLPGWLSFDTEGGGMLGISSDGGAVPNMLFKSFSSDTTINQKWLVKPVANEGHYFNYWKSPPSYYPDFYYQINQANGFLDVTGFRAGAESGFVAYFRPWGDGGTDTTGCETKTVNAKVFNALTFAEGGAEMGTVFPTGTRTKTSTGFFGSIVAEANKAGGWAFSHWIIKFTDKAGKPQSVIYDKSSYDLNQAGSCTVDAEAYFLPVVATPTPTPFVNLAKLKVTSYPEGTAQFRVSGKTELLASGGTHEYPSAGGIRISVIPAEGKAVTSFNMTGGRVLGKISPNSYYVDLVNGQNLFHVQTGNNPSAPLYVGTLTLSARSENGRGSNIELLGSDQGIFEPVLKNWESNPNAGIPVYAGQTLEVRLNQSNDNFLQEILVSHSFIRIEPSGSDTFKIHIDTPSFAQTGLDMRATFLSSTRGTGSVNPAPTPAGCGQPISVSIPHGSLNQISFNGSPDYQINRQQSATTGEIISESIFIPNPVIGKAYTFTVFNRTGGQFSGWNVPSLPQHMGYGQWTAGDNTTSYSINGNTLTVVAGQGDCQAPREAVFSAVAKQISNCGALVYDLYDRETPGALLDANDRGIGRYHQSVQIDVPGLSETTSSFHSYIREDGRFRIVAKHEGNFSSWVLQKRVEGPHWLDFQYLSQNGQRVFWPRSVVRGVPVMESLPVCPPTDGDVAFPGLTLKQMPPPNLGGPAHNPEIEPRLGASEGRGTVTLTPTKGAILKWRVSTGNVNSTTSPSPTPYNEGGIGYLSPPAPEKTYSRSGILPSDKSISLTIADGETLEAEASYDTRAAIGLMGEPKPFVVHRSIHTRVLETTANKISIAPQSGRTVSVTVQGVTRGGDASPTPSGTPGGGVGDVYLANGTAWYYNRIQSSDLIMSGANLSSFVLGQGTSRLLQTGELTGGDNPSIPILLALRKSDMSWGEVPGAVYSASGKVISVAKPPTGQSLTIRAVDGPRVTASPSASPGGSNGQWGTVRISSRVSSAPWYFEIFGLGVLTGRNGVVGLVGADEPIVMTEPPADWIRGSGEAIAEFRIWRAPSSISFSSTKHGSTGTFEWPKRGEVLELVIIDSNNPGGSPGPSASPGGPGWTPPPTASPSPSGSPIDATRGSVAMVIFPNNAGYFHDQDPLQPYLYGTIGQQYSLTARANWGWRLKKITYNLPGSRTAYVTGLGDSLVFGMPQSGTVTATFEPSGGGSSPGPVTDGGTNDSVGTMTLWNTMTDEQRIAYGIDKFLSEGLDPRLLTPATRAYADWSAIWKYYGWNALTEAQRKTVPIAQIWGRWDVTGYRITESDIKAGYNLGNVSSWGMGGLYLANRDLQGLSVNGTDFPLPYANFTGSNLSGLNLGNTHYVFYASNLAGATLGNINFGTSRYSFRDSNLAGANLAGSNHQGGESTFYYANLAGANLAGVSLDKSREAFFYSNLVGVNIEGVNLQGSWRAFCGANLTGVNFYGRTIYGELPFLSSILTGGNFAGADFSGIRDYAAAYANLVGVNFSGADFSDAGGYNREAFRHANLVGANLAGVDFAQAYSFGELANLTGANLSGINLTGASGYFSQANFTGVSSGGILGANRDFGNGWFLQDGYIFGPQVNLSGANLSGINLLSYNLNGVMFGGGGVTSSTSTKLPAGWQIKDGYVFGANVNLSGANFSGLNLEGVNLTGVTLSNIKVDNNTKLPAGWGYFSGYIIPTDGSAVTPLDLSGTNLEGMDLSQFNLTGWRAVNITGVPAALPDGYGIVGGMLVGRGVNLEGADLSGLNLSSYNLYGVRILNSKLSETVLPEGYKAVTTYWHGDLNLVVGPGVNVASDGGDFLVTNANLAGLDLSGANFSGARRLPFYSANLVGVNFSGSSFVGSDRPFYVVNVVGANFSGANFMGTGAPFGDGGYGSLNLSGVNFAGAQFQGGVGWGVQFFNVRSGGITGPSENLKMTGSGEWYFRGGYILGPGVNLSGANLSGINLLSLNLAGVIFRGGGVVTDANTKLPAGWQVKDGYVFGPNVNLSGANFSGLNLEGVNLAGVTLSNIKVDNNTKLPAGWGYVLGYIVPTDGSAATPLDLSGTNLEGMDLSQFNLTGWRAVNITGVPATLPDGYGIVTAGAERSLVGPGVNLYGASLSRADISMYNLEGAKILNLRNAGTTKLPPGYQEWGGGVLGRGSDLSGTDLFGRHTPHMWVGQDLSGINLAYSSKFGYESNFVGTNLKDIIWTRATQPFFGANLTGQNFAGVNFTSATGGVAEQANLNGANLSGIQAYRVTGDATKWSTIAFQTISAVGANLAGANVAGNSHSFQGGNLAGANLSGINATGTASFEYANLSGVSSGGIVGGDRFLQNEWWLRNGFIVGPSVNLSGQDLAGVDLRGVNLEGANLVGASGSGIPIDGSTKLPAGWAIVDGVLVGP
jgi:uncharacterized protein YjbI with pentapeptide repeats